MGVLIMKSKHYNNSILIFILSLLIVSCSFNNEVIEYEEKLVVFASIVANLPVMDTVFVSRSASLDENVTSGSLWVDDAQVKLIHDDSTATELIFYSLGSGRYFPVDINLMQTNPVQFALDIEKWEKFRILAGESYILVVSHGEDSLFAITEVPASFEITPAEMGDYECPDGQILPVGNVDVNNLDHLLDSLSLTELSGLQNNPDNFVDMYYIHVDSIDFRFGDCFTKSFASYPMFGLGFNDDYFQTIQIISYALEADSIDLEPLVDKNKNGNLNEEEFADWNRNGVRDSCYINLIYSDEKGYFNDDSLSYNNIARIWKEPVLRGISDGTWKGNSPYRYNPWLWNIETSPTVVMWLYFNYYGYYLMTFKATSESYFNYFSGDPVGQNIYLLPDSNLEGGLGVFYSSASTSFLVYVDRYDD